MRKTHPDDPRVPETLHLVVRATRFGCAGNDTGKISKAAFELLLKKYPKSDLDQTDAILASINFLVNLSALLS